MRPDEHKRDQVRKYYVADQSGLGELVREVIAGYDKEIAALTEAKAYAEGRHEVAISWERTLHERFREERAEIYRRHEEENREIIERVRFAAVAFNRILKAERNGKKTVRIADLLDGETKAEALR